MQSEVLYHGSKELVKKPEIIVEFIKGYEVRSDEQRL